MKQIIKVIRKVDFIKEQIQVLELETDYLLISLSRAMQENNEKEKSTCKVRLGEIHVEVEDLRNQLSY